MLPRAETTWIATQADFEVMFPFGFSVLGRWKNHHSISSRPNARSVTIDQTGRSLVRTSEAGVTVCSSNSIELTGTKVDSAELSRLVATDRCSEALVEMRYRPT